MFDGAKLVLLMEVAKYYEKNINNIVYFWTFLLFIE